VKGAVAEQPGQRVTPCLLDAAVIGERLVDREGAEPEQMVRHLVRFGAGLRWLCDRYAPDRTVADAQQQPDPRVRSVSRRAGQLRLPGAGERRQRAIAIDVDGAATDLRLGDERVGEA